MKRLVWLTLAVFCTALAQVQSAPLPAPQGDECGCCEDRAGTTSGCDHHSPREMADCLACLSCAPAPSTLLPADVALPPAHLVEICRLDCPAESGRELAYPPLLPPPRLMA